MPTIARVAVLWSVALCTSALAETQLTPDGTVQLNKVAKQCVAAVHAAPSEQFMEEFYRKFDAYYNSRTGRVENNVTTMGDQKAYFVFKKCMSEKGYPLGG
jgi:hypothetical protein